MKRIYNFSAGPGILPLPVLEEAAKGVLEINNSGMSILEVSHRGKDYETIHHNAEQRLLKLLGLTADTHQALFLGGGASTQFAMLPMNFLAKDQTADYVNTGEWAAKAIKEAQRFGNVHVAASSEDTRFNCIPASLQLTPGARYLHITTNNTIEGTEWQALPECGSAPLIADCSSDIFARQLDYSRFSLLYAGAQKNAGPAGVTLLAVRRDFLQTANTDLPAMFAYNTHAKADSLYNTPPVFPIYVVDLVLQWIEREGGIAAVEDRNRRKAGLVYEALDAYPAVYEPTVPSPAHRSLMNVTFRLRDTSLDSEFLAGAAARNMDGLKGHRSVGGFRASIYNAFPEEGCQALAEYLHAFARAHAA